MTIVDHAGKRLGEVIGFGGVSQGALIALRVDEELLVLGADSNRLYGTRSVLVFESADCSGTPFMDDIGGIEPPSVVWSSRVFTPTPDEPRRMITVNSVVSVEPDKAVCEDRIAAPQEVLMRPARQIMNIADHFTPPFALE
jgi:hypothetical protein